MILNYITQLYFLVENQYQPDEKVIFLYGNSLPTQKTPLKTSFQSNDYSKKIKILLATTIASSYPASTEVIDLKGFIGKEDISPSVSYKREIIQVSNQALEDAPPSILTTPLHSHVYQTSEIYDFIDEKKFDDAEIAKLMDVLKKFSGIPFDGEYQKRIGCYEVIRPQSWSEDIVTPFDLRAEKEIDKENIVYMLVIDQAYYNAPVLVHLIVYNDYKEIVYDSVKNTPGGNRTEITRIKKGENASCEYWIFDLEGNLLDRAKYSFIKEINFMMSLGGNSYNVSRDVLSNKSPLKDKDRTVATYGHAHTSHIKPVEDHPLTQRVDSLYNRIKVYRQEQIDMCNGIWFEKVNINGKDMIIDFLNNITSNAPYKMTVVDPFISSTASMDYLLHLKNQQIVLEFISCWEDGISPDDSDNKVDTEKSIEEMQTALDSIKDYSIPLRNVYWYNLSPPKLFHDRFIHIENTQTKEIKVYSMSNSLNNMLRKYDLLIMPLHGTTLKRSIKYIQELKKKCTDTYRIYPKANNND